MMLIQVLNTPPGTPHTADALDSRSDSAALAPAAARPDATRDALFDPASPTPLYSQIREALRNQIHAGAYCGDGRLPSENELVRAYGVSRITVRQALNDLQKEGLIFKVHGKGTFVSRPKAVQNMMRLEGFGEAMAAAGHATHSRVLGHRVLHASQHIAARLHLPDGSEVMEIRRVRHLDRDPISLDITYVPVELGRRLVKEDLPHRDIFVILEHDYGYTLDRAELRIDATLADAMLARELATNEGAPVLRIERLTMAVPDQPLDFEYLYFRGDAFQTFMMVGRRSGQGVRTSRNGEKGRP